MKTTGRAYPKKAVGLFEQTEVAAGSPKLDTELVHRLHPEQTLFFSLMTICGHGAHTNTQAIWDEHLGHRAMAFYLHADLKRGRGA